VRIGGASGEWSTGGRGKGERGGRNEDGALLKGKGEVKDRALLKGKGALGLLAQYA